MFWIQTLSATELFVLVTHIRIRIHSESQPTGMIEDKFVAELLYKHIYLLPKTIKQYSLYITFYENIKFVYFYC